MKHALLSWLWLAGCLAPLSCTAPAGPPGNAGTHSAPLMGKATVEVYVVLDGPAAADLLPSTGVAVSPPTLSAVRGRLRRLSAEHAALLPAIKATGATVTADLKRLVNAIQVRVPRDRIRDLRSLPGVLRVDPVTTLYRDLGQAVPLIGAPQVWQLAPPIRGQGIRIGIVDTGIDYTHADFGGPGTVAAYQQNDPTVIEPGSFPTARVVGGWDFVGDDYDASKASTSIPKPDPDPLDCERAANKQIAGGHGTHVSGIAAGNGVLQDGTAYTGPYDMSLDPAAFKVFPGVAPEARLYALKIFGCEGSTDQLAAALERASDPNQDGDFSDHLDVVNASLGTSYGSGSQTEAKLIENLTKTGTLLVVAAGNDGETFYTVGSPGAYPAALTVAASASSNFLAMKIDSPASIQGNVVAAEGAFTTRLSTSGPITDTLVYAEPHDACSQLQNAFQLKGHIALIDRGTCPFLDKLNAAVAAGAVAAVVVDNVDTSVLLTMSGGQPGSVPIPGVLIREVDGAVIKPDLDQGVTVTLDSGLRYDGAGSETVAPFSSRGPSSNDNLLKPDVSAPGFAIKSARVGSGTGPSTMSGTSMASPMVAGAAALVRQARPELSPVEVKAALMNTAKVVENLAGNRYPTSMQGAGRIQIDAAVTQHVTAMESGTDGSVGLSFGAVITDKPYSDTRQVTLQNHGTSPVDYQASTVPGYTLPGVVLDVTPKTLTLKPGETTSVTVTLVVDPQALGAPGPDPETPAKQNGQARHFITEASGRVVFTDTNKGAETIGVPYEAVVRAAGDRHAAPLTGCAPGKSGGVLQIPITGESAYPGPVVTAFELGAWHEPQTGETASRALLDLVAIGAATDTATQDVSSASVYFGLAIAGQWTTPALGPLSRVAVAIDTNFDKKADYAIMAEPLTRSGPYADVLVATTYDVATQKPVGSKRFINMVAEDTLRTEPFDNSVLVLSTFLKTLGLKGNNAHFEYSGMTQSNQFGQSGQQTKWIDYDALHPRIDTAQGGLEGKPIYEGDGPVVVRVGATSPENLPQVLLLHHMNVQGKRWERVDLSGIAGLENGNLKLSVSGPDHARLGDPIAFQVKLLNASTAGRAGVDLTGSVSGARFLSATPDRGTCTAESKLSCHFGTMKPGETITVKLDARAPDLGSDQAELQLDATSTNGCESTLNDNHAKLDVALTTPPVPPVPVYEPTGGCSGCQVGSTRESPAGAAFGSLLLALGLCWRRRYSGRHEHQGPERG